MLTFHTRSVDSVSVFDSELGVTQQIITVNELPPNAFCSSRVNLLSRYSTCLLQHTTGSAVATHSLH